jgi:DNA polymerase I
MRKAIFIDSNHLLSRTFHVPSFQELKTTINDEVVFTGAAYGFLLSLKRLVERYKEPDDTLVAVWDGGRGFRVEISAQYKANRAAKTPVFLRQIDLTKQFLRALGVAQCQVKNTEADDIIATLTKRARLKNFDVLIISGDKDFNQIVSEHVHVLNPKGHDEYVMMTPESVESTYGVTPKQFVDYLALVGDSSDNVEGIDGVGKKTAAQLIRCNGSVEDIISADTHYKFDDDGSKKPVSKKLQEKLTASKHILKLAKQLVQIKSDFTDFDVDCPEPDFMLVKAMFKQYSFKTLLNSFNEFVAVFS